MMNRLRASKNSNSDLKAATLTMTVEGGLPSPVSTMTDESAVDVYVWLTYFQFSSVQHPRPLNCSFFPLPRKEGLFIAKGEGAKRDSLSHLILSNIA